MGFFRLLKNKVLGLKNPFTQFWYIGLLYLNYMWEVEMFRREMSVAGAS